MIAGLSACLMVRIWVSLNGRSTALWTWAIDLTVTAITMLFTAGWVALQRPAPFFALLSGTGFGALGAGIIALAIAWVRRIAPLGGSDNTTTSDNMRDVPDPVNSKRCSADTLLTTA